MKSTVWKVPKTESTVFDRSQSIAQPSICQVMCGFAKNARKNTRAMISYLSALNIISQKFVTVER
jgi:hypothetical protein